jgi:hypothetical protein
MVKFNKRNNYIDGQFVDIDDFKTEQNYFLEKSRSITSHLGQNGATALRGLDVVPDTSMVEPIAQSEVAIEIGPSPDITAPNPQNFSVFPASVDTSTTRFQFYTVFKTKTQNIQRLDLRMTLGQAITTEQLDIIIRLRQLVDGTNPLSPLSNNPPLFEVQLEQSEIPADGSDDFLNLDLSNESSGQGVAVFKDFHYAIEVEYRRPVGSTSNIKVFHVPLNQIEQLDQNLLTFIYTPPSSASGKYQQRFDDINGIERRIQIYHKVSTSAIKVVMGEAIIDGNRTVVEEDQFRFVEIPDRRNVDTFGRTVYNFVVLRYTEIYTDTESIKATRNLVNTRVKDSSKVEILTQPQWDNLVADSTQRNTYLLLATVNDSNIVSVFKKQQFTIPSNSTNLAYHDWLNPFNTIPTTEATAIQSARPSDFIFFLSNVPAQVPLTDALGNLQLEPTTIFDEFGNVIKRAGDPVLDDIVRVVVNFTLANGSTTRSLELATVSEVGTTTKFRNYSSTISSLFDNPFDNVFTFNFNTDQLAPNVTYNFVAFTKRGLPIFIQDYNRTITQSNTVNTIRDKQYSVFLETNSKTIVINEDLKLGAFNPASDQSQPGVTQYVPTLIANESLIPVGLSQTEYVTFDNLVEGYASESFLFPAPLVLADGTTKIPNTDSAVQSAYNVADITILIDTNDGNGPVDITFSGPTDRDRGGNGSAVLVTGTIDDSILMDNSIGWEIKVRNSLGRDNTNYSSLFSPYGPAQVGGPSDIRTFNVLARGYDGIVVPLNVAGFNDGETVYVYVNDRRALDQNFNPITFVYNSLDTTILLPKIYHLDSQKYFREKQIKSIENSTSATPGVVLIDTGLDLNGELRNLGQIIFNSAEIPTSIDSETKVYIRYNSVLIYPNNIDYFQTRFKTHGTRDGFRIANTNTTTTSSDYISVPEAIALSSSLSSSIALNPATFATVALFVDGINITSLVCPIGQKEIVADTGASLLPGQVAYNPELGTLKFYKTLDAYNNITSEAPEDFTRLSISYYKLETKFVFNTTTNITYEPKFDINNDGRIDELDLNAITRALGSSIGDPNYLAAADFNSDGKVDSVDLELFQEHFGAVALGEPDYSDATLARLNSLLVVKQDDFLTKLKVVRAVSRAPDATAPNGRTVLFLDSSSSIAFSSNYLVLFGFEASLSLGYIQAEIETVRPLLGNFNLNNIEIYEAVNPTNTREVVQIESSQIPNTNNRYNSVITFSPAVNATSEFLIKSLWSDRGLAIKNAKDLIIPQKYEQLDRKVYGPFKLQYTNNDFKSDGTLISATLKVSDATFADGSPDPSGTHINGIPLSQLTFTAHLTIPNGDQTSSIWTWHNIQPLGIDNRLVFSFNDSLFIDHRSQGKGGVEVLTPFGLGLDQVNLKPHFAGGDLENDLSNISVIRSDVASRYVAPHHHTSDRDGGVLNSRTVQFADDLARLNLVDGDVTDAIYRLLDIIADQEAQIQLIRAIEGIYKWDKGLLWDQPDLFYDS